MASVPVHTVPLMHPRTADVVGGWWVWSWWVWAVRQGMGVGGQAGHGCVGMMEGRQWVHGWEGMCACMHGHESRRVSVREWVRGRWREWDDDCRPGPRHLTTPLPHGLMTDGVCV